MSLGVVLLVHGDLARVADVARIWALACPVVMHVDAQVSDARFARLQTALADLDNVRFCKRYRCEWGMWGLVAATQTAVQDLLDGFKDVQHVYMASGACLPLRPVAELEAYLRAHHEVDFIESYQVGQGEWVQGGFEAERFTRHFPFSWKKRRWLFDRLVDVQRFFGIKRRVPAELVPHVGGQWWCLRRKTLEAILNDPKRAEFDRYFKGVWIPDESYFQTLVRRHSRNIECRSLTLSRFDHLGKPHIFYDDHAEVLAQTKCFVARKVWSGADGLYAAFPKSAGDDAPRASAIDPLTDAARARRAVGRAGLVMQSRCPHDSWECDITAAPYEVFYGYSELFEGFAEWYATATGACVHGHLFGPKAVEFAGGVKAFAGGLSAKATLRDRDPRSFLRNLIWNTRGQKQVFQFGPADNQANTWMMAKDPNAKISVVEGAWILPLLASGKRVQFLAPQAARLQHEEAKFLEVMRSPWRRADVRVYSLSDILEDPSRAFEHTATGDVALPVVKDVTGLGRFVQELKNHGVNLQLTGDFSSEIDHLNAARSEQES